MTVTARLRTSRRQLERVRQLVYARDLEVCAVCGNPGCLPLQIQHRVPRQMGGRSRDPDAHRPDRLVTVGLPCHDWIETKARKMAVNSGFLVPGGMNAEHCPVHYWDGWYFLDADGTRRRVAVHPDG